MTIPPKNLMVLTASRYQATRHRMVEDQLIARGVTDARVLAAVRKVPRHLFVTEEMQEQAYSDHALPIGEGQTISQPYMVGFMSEALELMGSEKVLEIGTGSGYQTAILAELAARVFSIERVMRFVEQGWKRIEHLHYQNVVLRAADGTYGWKEESPFDAILVAAGAPTVPQPLVDQLKVGGRMVIPIGPHNAQVLHKVVKSAHKTVITPLIPCLFVPLRGAFGWKETKISPPPDALGTNDTGSITASTNLSRFPQRISEIRREENRAKSISAKTLWS